MKTRLFPLTCMLIGLALPQRVEAKSGPSPDTANLDEPKSHSVRSWEDEHRQGLQAMRLSVAIGALNVPWLKYNADQQE